MQTVGVIGLGLLGSAIAERFIRGGLKVIGYDLRGEHRKELTAAGGVAVNSSVEVAAMVPLVVLSLPDSKSVATVVREIEQEMKCKAIIDTTTGDPAATAALGRRLAGQHIGYVDATIAGSSRQVRDGEPVIVMAGGEGEVCRTAEALFKHIPSQWFHVGPWGSGSRMKLVVNLVLGLNRAVLAEGLSFARQIGVDLNAALKVLRAGPAYSRVMDIKGERMISGDFEPEGRLSQHLKDVRLILEAGRRGEAELPFSRLHEGLLTHLEALGFGGLDNSAIIRAFEIEHF